MLKVTTSFIFAQYDKEKKQKIKEIQVNKHLRRK